MIHDPRENLLYFFSTPRLARVAILREMPRSPRLAHKAPVMQARVSSLLSWKRALLLGFAVYGFGTQKLINQEIFGFISNTCFFLVLCLRCQRCQIGLAQITRQFARQNHLVWDHFVHWLQFQSQSNTLLCLVTVLLWLKNSSLNLKTYKQSSHELFCR